MVKYLGTQYESDRLAKHHDEYVKSGVMKCGKSPTGYHHWKEVKLNGIEAGTFVCKYCWDNKIFPVSFHK